MLKNIVEVRPLGGYRIHVRFEDGVEGEVDLEQVIEFKGVFEPLRDQTEFVRMRVHPELGTVVWSNGADLDPDVLYSRIVGKPIDLAGLAARR